MDHILSLNFYATNPSSPLSPKAVPGTTTTCSSSNNLVENSKEDIPNFLIEGKTIECSFRGKAM